MTQQKTTASSESGAPVVEVDHLIRRYGQLAAVNDISFSIRQGEIFGMLGPNGAGKSTTLEIIEGLRTATSGTARVLGMDVSHNRRAVQQQIGVQLQATTFFENLTVREMISLFTSLYPRSLKPSDLIREVALEEKAKSYPVDLSGGQRQRLALALALANDPAVLFLDEPTTGLDPQSRHMLWDTIRKLRANGKTIILTTHFMDEAQALCDRIAIIDHGRIVALNSPSQLITLMEASAAIECTIRDKNALPTDALRAVPYVTDVREGLDSTTLYSDNAEQTLIGLLHLAEEHSTTLDHLQLHAPTLEDVFLKLTGRNLRD
jgi:ABC-2 type transport system ATP-binding protein